ncbi:phospholipid-binding protein MlaC [Motiliproteus sp. MSK22-1]|uniref:MlaC/ttg2D family ABC transporter substrate-binding protein n=1 Tax=Motiliproteus sp. MSK22-1 TaxID=1897630 RepID=UPI000978CD32|nr:ABC transporter substrate-binding protein [Motiliproteus sp. MSK22-1]OMH38293.1 hypothetical protein BGP75_08600 [Motiliproteus sp. MSK22-1]
MYKLNTVNQFRILLGVLLCLTLQFLAPSLVRASVAEPNEVIEERFQSIQGLIENKVLVPGMSEEALLELMDQELSPVFDFPRVARKVMGKFARNASKDQLSRFTGIFKKTLIATYSKGLEQIDQLDHVEVEKTVLDKKGTRAKVSSYVVLKNGQKYQVVYSLFLKEGRGWLVENINVEGVNIGVVFRNQFAHYMEQYNQSIDKVLTHWGE